jgi:NADH-quinone oxidoreductase subunit J
MAVTRRNAVASVLWLVGAFVAMAVLFIGMDAGLLGVIQVLVYAGAIMMLVVFVIMVLNQAKEHTIPVFDWLSVVALVLPVVLGIALVTTQGAAHVAPVTAKPPRGEVATIAATMFNSSATGGGYWLLFELTGVVLLAAVVGAVVLAKRKLDSPPPEQPKADGGHH